MNQRSYKVLLLGGCFLLACQSAESQLVVAARIQAKEIRECSGIVASRQHPGVFWVHNDSGNQAQLFAIDAHGRLLCEVDVRNADNVDWEDLTLDDAGNLYVGDFGNNRNERRDLQVLVIPEPDPSNCRDGLQADVVRRIPFRFPEQTEYANPDRMNFDCEAVFWLEGALYVFTKHRSDSRTALYRLPSGSDTDAVLLGGFDAKGMVTAAAVSDDGRWLVVLTYEYVHLFELQSGAASLASLGDPVHSTLIEGRQCEAVCFDGDTIVFANEQREIYRIPRTPWQDELLPAIPVAQVTPVEVTSPEAVRWSEIEPLKLQPEYVDGRAPQGPAPLLRLTRSSQALICRLDLGPGGVTGDAKGRFLEVLVGPNEGRKAFVARHEDLEYRISRKAGAWSVRCQTILACQCADRDEHDQAHADAAILHLDESAGVLTVSLPLDASLVQHPAAALRVNVIVRERGSKKAEWAWGATSSARPEENVLLWGRLESAPGR